jgi:hypothetical protein
MNVIRRSIPWWAPVAAAFGAVCADLPSAAGQGMSSSSLRPFVIAVVPVVGRNGAVGGVSVDTAGVLDRASLASTVRLREVRRQALRAVPGDLGRRSPCRKISLRQLDAALAEHRQAGTPLTGDLLFLAGLQRVNYVLVYPESRDIVLAGPAEGWCIDDTGEAVGATTKLPVLQLDDLIVALRTATAAAHGDGVTCSIEPTTDGFHRFQRLIATRSLRMSRSTVGRLEQVLGPSVIRITGVPPDTHFAHVMVAADFLMKRLAMNFEPAPVNGLPSYLELLRGTRSTEPPPSIFRLWLAPAYRSVLRDPEGLAWELEGEGVQALTEDGWLARDPRRAHAGRAHPAAEEWAETFSEKFGELAVAMPAFGRLRACMDLAVAAAILTKEDLRKAADCGLPLLHDHKLVDVARYPTPRKTPSRASYLESGDGYLVSLSGGVDLDSWAVVRGARVSGPLTTLRKQAAAPAAAGWWWD